MALGRLCHARRLHRTGAGGRVTADNPARSRGVTAERSRIGPRWGGPRLYYIISPSEALRVPTKKEKNCPSFEAGQSLRSASCSRS